MLIEFYDCFPFPAYFFCASLYLLPLQVRPGAPGQLFVQGRIITMSMSRHVVFRLPGGEIKGELSDVPGIDSLLSQLPVSSKGNVWGEEIYFEITREIPVGRKTKDVDVGDIAYWEEGKSVCIFFGPTPVSRSSRPEPYVPVFTIGKVEIDDASMKVLREFEQGNIITLEKSSVR